MRSARSIGLFVFGIVMTTPPFAGAEPAAEVPREGLELWFDASAGVVEENGSLKMWQDGSGRKNHATRIAGIPSNPASPRVVAGSPSGKPVLRWDGSDSAFAFKRVETIRTVFFVMNRDRAAFGRYNQRFILADLERGTRYDADFHIGTHFTDFIWHPTISSPFVRAGKTRLNGTLVDGTITEMPTELAVMSLVTTASISASQLSRDRQLKDGRSWHGDVAEILVYSVPLPDRQREAVERYLLGKYGISPGWGAVAEPSRAQRPRLAIAGAHGGPVTSVAVSPDGKTIASASSDGLVRTWDLSTGKRLQNLTGHAGKVWSVVFTPDGRQVLSGGGDQTARLWDATTGKPVRTYRQDGGDPRDGVAVWRAEMSPDGKLVAGASLQRSHSAALTWITLWDAGRGRLYNLLDGHDQRAWWVTWSRDGKQLASSSEDGVIKLWDPATGRASRVLDARSPPLALSFHPEGKALVSAHPDGLLRVWNLERGILQRTRPGHAGALFAAVYSADGKLVATAGADRTIALWDSASWELLERFVAHDDDVLGLAFAPDGKLLVSAGKDRALKVWNVRPAPGTQAAK